MKTLKKISILVLLAILTWAVVFVPRLISGQRENNILNKTVYRNYKAANRPKLTSEEVARYYCNGEIGIIDNSLAVNNDNSDVETVRADVIALLEMLFGEGDFVCESIDTFIVDNDFNYFRRSNLIKIDNKPTALNFVICDIKNDSGIFEITYEEKTKTIIKIIYNSFACEFDNIKEMDTYFEKVSSTIINYYKKQLCSNEGEYYYNIDVPIIIEQAPSGYIVDIYIDCGLIQQGDKYMEEVELFFK